MTVHRQLAAVVLATAVLLGTPSGAPGQVPSGSIALTAEEAAGLEVVRHLIQETARTYSVPVPVAARVALWVETIGVLPRAGGVSSGGRLYLAPGALTSRYLDALVAAALASDLAHRPSRARSLGDFDRERRQQFMDAHAKAVEVLARAKGWPEWTALDAIYEWLFGQHRAGAAVQKTVIGQGRATPCEEIADLLGRFPHQQEWTAGLACAGKPEPGPTAIRASAEPPGPAVRAVVATPPAGLGLVGIARRDPGRGAGSGHAPVVVHATGPSAALCLWVPVRSCPGWRPGPPWSALVPSRCALAVLTSVGRCTILGAIGGAGSSHPER